MRANPVSNDIHCLYVHGVGQQKSGYSIKAQQWLAAAREPHKSYGREVLWAPVLDTAERTMMREVSRRGSANKPLQRLVVETLADALCYQNRLDQIFDKFDQAYVKLRAPGPVHVFSHSLGSVLVMAWLKARPTVQVSKMVMFGTNLQLFNLGAEGKWQCPAQLIGGKPGSKLLNFFDSDDCLGWPVRGWIPQARDIEVSVGSWLTGWTGLAHIGYFTTKSFWRKVAREL